MKRVISILLVFVMCISLCSCGGTDKETMEMSAEEAIVGKWTYFTGLTTWNFVFNEDMTCSYWAGAREPENTTYKMEEGRVIVEGLDWDLFYEVVDKKMEFWQDTKHEDGSRSEWKFTKDNSYNPEDIKSLALTDKMMGEIEATIADDFEWYVLTMLQLAYEDYDFTDLEFTNQQKIDPYTYELNGIVYAKDNYGEKYYQKFDIKFTANESLEEEKGYAVDWDIEFVD